MREFKDSKGGTWEINLTFGTVMRVKRQSEGKFDLLDAAKLSETLLNDLGEFWEMLQVLTEPQAKERGINADQFGQLMAADCVHVAQDKFFREWSDFFRGLQRHEMATALELAIDQKAKAMKKLKTRVEEEMAIVASKTDQATDRILNSEFGKLRDSLASILES